MAFMVAKWLARLSTLKLNKNSKLFKYQKEIEKYNELRNKWIEFLPVEIQEEIERDFSIMEEIDNRMHPKVYVVKHFDKRSDITSLYARCNFVDRYNTTHKYTLYIDNIEAFPKGKDDEKAIIRSEEIVMEKIQKDHPL